MKLILFIYFIVNSLPNPFMDSNPFAQYQWENRILVIYTEDTGNSNFEQQLANFELHKKAYEDRDLIVIQISGQFVYQLPQNQLLNMMASQAKDFLSIEDNEAFHLSLIGKDGNIKNQSRSPISNQKLFALIDAMPMRQNEMNKH